MVKAPNHDTALRALGSFEGVLLLLTMMVPYKVAS